MGHACPSHRETIAMKLLIHAPTAAALERARVGAALLTRHNPEDMVRIVADGDGAGAAHATESPDTDHLLILCRSSLEVLGIAEPAGVEITPHAYELMGRLQKKGWAYIRS